MMRRILAVLVGLAIAAGQALAEAPLPFAVGGPFRLTDQWGHARSEADPDGRAQLLVFGYANCQGICSQTLPLMADVADAVSARGVALVPVLITVDPARDTVGTMSEPLARLHPAFVGLTGSEDALRAARRAFSVEMALAHVDPQEGPVYSHGSFLYLLDGAGKVLSVLPPVLDAERVTEIALGYLAPER